MNFITRLANKSEKIELKTLADCDSDTIEQLRLLRNLPAIRENMYTNHEITEKEHANWVSHQASNEREKFYAVLHEGTLVGGASLNKIEKHNKRAEWAFYLDPEMQGKGLGASLEYKFLELAFGTFKLQKLDCEVLEFNEAVISMHIKFGFRKEGQIRQRIIRNGKPVDAIRLGITSSEWQEIKAK